MSGRGYRPEILAHVRLRRAGDGRWAVVLDAAGRRMLAPHRAARFADGQPTGRGDVTVGFVEARHGRDGTTAWGFDGSGAYVTAREAGDSLAVQELVGGARARHAFDVARRQRRQPRADRPETRVRRLWWRCSVCRRRFDLFGVDHDNPTDRRAAGEAVLFHLDEHGVHLDNLDAAAALLEPAGSSGVHVNKLLATLDTPRPPRPARNVDRPGSAVRQGQRAQAGEPS